MQRKKNTIHRLIIILAIFVGMMLLILPATMSSGQPMPRKKHSSAPQQLRKTVRPTPKTTPTISAISTSNLLLKVFDTKKKKAVSMPLEEYVKGVVSGEMYASFPLEALKAQAVAARTLAVYQQEGHGCTKHKGCDVCTDFGHCQAFGDKKDAIFAQAVQETQGQILTYRGKAALLFYHGGSNKATEDGSVFGVSLPYLVSVPAPYPGDTRCRIYAFQTADFCKKINSAFAEAGLKQDQLPQQVKVLSHTQGGRVAFIELGSAIIQGKALRPVLGLPSAEYQVDMDKDQVVFRVYGGGHGVGMSQYGARDMAVQGKKFDAILAYFYPGTTLQKVAQKNGP